MRRAADANLNRAREGLRVLEEVARFALDEVALTARLKDMRHQLVPNELSSAELLSHRRASEDEGAFLNPPAEMERPGLPALVLANAKRVEESLRVLEELAKLPDGPPFGSATTYKDLRFAVYEAEKEVLDRLLRREKAAKIRGLYVIVDPEMTSGRPPDAVARQAIAGGASVIQLRDKRLEKGATLATARRLKDVCAEGGAVFIVNDHVDVAMAAGADGVHVGQKDLPVAVVRRMVPLGMIVGCSTALVGEALQAEKDGADYVGVGAMFPTATKDNTRPAGPTTLRAVKEAVRVPTAAIGGINADNVGEVMAAGADAVAVISAVVAAVDVAGAARRLCEKMAAGRL